VRSDRVGRAYTTLEIVQRLSRRSVLAVLGLGAVACRVGSVASTDAAHVEDGASGGDASRAAPERFVSLGDSFTAGTGASPEESFAARAVDRWRALGLSIEHENPAVNGFTTGDVIQRELAVLERVRPSIVTLAIGANNIVRGLTDDAYRADVRAILERALAAQTLAQNVVALPQPEWPRSPAGATFGDPRATLARVRVFNDILRDEALRVRCSWLDLAPLMSAQATQAMWAPDGLHPSAAAYDQWAEALVRARPRIRL
jgi:lysophospholipase L1-like esterase